MKLLLTPAAVSELELWYSDKSTEEQCCFTEILQLCAVWRPRRADGGGTVSWGHRQSPGLHLSAFCVCPMGWAQKLGDGALSVWLNV